MPRITQLVSGRVKTEPWAVWSQSLGSGSPHCPAGLQLWDSPQTFHKATTTTPGSRLFSAVHEPLRTDLSDALPRGNAP